MASSSYRAKPLQRISRAITGWIRKYDQNWWARMVKVAYEEDIAGKTSVKDPYKSHAWANIAIHSIASNIARVPFRVMQGENVITNTPAAKLFQNPNPIMTDNQLWEATASWMKCRGECFWIYDMFMDAADRSIKMPTQIGLVNPDCMKQKVDKNGNITIWIYEKGDEKIPIMPDELVHFAYWNKYNPYRGAPPLSATGQELSMDNESDQSNLNILRHGSVPDGVLSSDQYVDEKDAKKIKSQWLSHHQGAGRKGMLSVLGQGMSYQAIQMTPKDMEYLGMKKWNRQTILARLGVPGVLVGVSDDRSPMSGSDTKYQRKVFWNLTLIPDMDFFTAKVKAGFFDRFHLPYTGEFDLSEIPELQEDEDERTERLLKEVNSGTLTINEYRDLQGRDPVQWGDAWYISLALVPAGEERPPSPLSTAPKDLTPITEIFQTAEVKAGYTSLFREMIWKQVIQSWEHIEIGYQKDLAEWIMGMRARVLEIITREKSVALTALDEIMQAEYWMAQEAEMARISKVWFFAALDESEKHLSTIFDSIGLDVSPNWTIYNTRAVSAVNERVNKITRVTEKIRENIDDAVQASIKEGLGEREAAMKIRDTFNGVKNRAKTIARTEIGGVMNTARIEGYEDVGIKYHEWTTSKDGNVRELHQIEGEAHAIGELFSNGLRWPLDENGEASNVINCRCLTLPYLPKNVPTLTEV